ncbi:hypothetical protein BpHYR1_052059, partial [Brachionus plicatilis]
MTPRLHTSTSGPSYFLPWNSSGAAYGGLPQNVSSLLPGVNSLLKPKSAILMFMSASSIWITSYNLTMLGWSRHFIIFTSRNNFCNELWFSWVLSIILMATCLPMSSCLASFTLAKLPLPIVLIRRYLPMCGSSALRVRGPFR